MTTPSSRHITYTVQEKLDLIVYLLDRLSTHINKEIRSHVKKKSNGCAFSFDSEKNYIEELRNMQRELGEIHKIIHQRGTPVRPSKEVIDRAGIPIISPYDSGGE